MSSDSSRSCRTRDRRFGVGALLVAALLGAMAACTPAIGDQCVLSTDCSTQGERLCDTSQPGGYCTEFNCKRNSCPDLAACVVFNAAIPGCAYNDRNGNNGSRAARSFCVAKCSKNSDCRSGYVCADPHAPPWNGILLDEDQSKLTCLVPPPGTDLDGGPIMSAAAQAPVCSAVAPEVGPIDASTTPIPEAGTVPPLVPDAGRSVDAGDAGDAGDGGDGG